jgi:hypothetical protein
MLIIGDVSTVMLRSAIKFRELVVVVAQFEKVCGESEEPRKGYARTRSAVDLYT